MKNITRREFIKGAATLGAFACCSAGLGIGRPQLAFGQLFGSNSANSNTVVMFNLFGGCDHLNSFAIPYERGAYYSIRPTIAIPGNNCLPTDSGFAFHPSLTALHQLYLSGDVTIFPSIAEPIGSRSHFTAQEYMSLADGGSKVENVGWVGSISDQLCNKANGSNGSYNFQFATMGIGVGQQRDFQTRVSAGNSSCKQPVVVTSLSGYTLTRDANANNDSILQEDTARQVLNNSDLAEKTQMQNLSNQNIKSIYENINEVQRIVTQFAPIQVYPNTRAGNYFKDVSVLIRSGIGVKLTYGGMGGWDNHANIGGITGTQATLLSQFNAALQIFTNDMKQAGLWNKVVILVFTEFGRTNKENTSLGTDHGWAGAILAIGGGIKRGVLGNLPTDQELNNSSDRIIPSADYREAYFPVLSWADIDPSDVFRNYRPANNYQIFKT